MSVPSCPLALTNPIQLHTLRCSGGPYAPKSSHRHAKTCLFPSRYQFDMSFTYIDELILAQVAAGNIRQILRDSVEATSDRQIVFLLERQRQAPFYIHGNQYACVHACSGESADVVLYHISSKCAEIFATHIGTR